MVSARDVGEQRADKRRLAHLRAAGDQDDREPGHVAAPQPRRLGRRLLEERGERRKRQLAPVLRFVSATFLAYRGTKRILRGLSDRDRGLLVGPVTLPDVRGELLELLPAERRPAALVQLHEGGEDLVPGEPPPAHRAGDREHRLRRFPSGITSSTGAAASSRSCSSRSSYSQAGASASLGLLRWPHVPVRRAR